MPVSGLLLTVDPAREPVLRQVLTADTRTVPGELIGARLPLALATADKHADQDAWDWLRTLPGVSWIDLVWVALDAPTAGESV